MIAFTFPGQGSQRPGVGAEWTEHPSWELVDEASDAAGRDVAHLLLHADAETLQETRNAQLATYVASKVALDAVDRLGVSPALVAGHSLGEYSALTAAGVVGFEEGVRLVVERGDAMQRAADERAGTMASVLGLDEEQAAVACARAGGDAWPANYNAPGHTVVAGTPEGIEGAKAVAKELGGPLRRVPRPRPRTGHAEPAGGMAGRRRGVTAVRLTGWGTALYADRGDVLRMDGREVFRRAVRAMVESSAIALDRVGTSAADIDLFVAHQANRRIIDATCSRLGIPTERTALVLERTGNTSAASIPLALADALDAGRLDPGDLVLLSGVGAGLAWGSAVLRWQP